MKTAVKTAILVGGPGDGRKQNVLYGKSCIQVVVLEEPRVAYALTDWQDWPDAKATTRLHIYTERKVNFQGEDPVTYYAHEDLTDREALILLLEGRMERRTFELLLEGHVKKGGD